MRLQIVPLDDYLSLWRGSNNAVRREILDLVCLNRALGDVNLDATKRKPFDVFAEGLDLKKSRSDRIWLELLNHVEKWPAELMRIVLGTKCDEPFFVDLENTPREFRN